MRKIGYLARNRVVLFTPVRRSTNNVTDFLAKVGVHKIVPVVVSFFQSLLGESEWVEM